MRGYLAGRHPTSSPGLVVFNMATPYWKTRGPWGPDWETPLWFAKVVICAWAEIQPGSSVPCEQTENNEWFRMNEVSVQIFSGNSRFVFS